jgi:hypothetical protein
MTESEEKLDNTALKSGKNYKPKTGAKQGDSNANDKQNSKVLAHARHPIIDAVIKMRYTFSSYEDALDKIDYLEKRFVKSSLSESVTPDTTVLWIRGYEVTEAEEEKGYQGNYAVITPEMTPDKKYTLIARKIEIDLGKHPQRRRNKSKHPDWGYWVLRRVQKGWRYDSVEEAYKDLMAIAEDFPEVSIPSTNKLLTIIYRKTTDGSLPLFRVILEVEALREGGFTITCKENEHKGAKKPKAENAITAEGEEPEQIGRFASMVALKKNRKKNINDVLNEKKNSESE